MFLPNLSFCCCKNLLLCVVFL